MGDCNGIIDTGMPFGGYKQSGCEGSRYAIELFTQVKSVCVVLGLVL